MKILVKKLRPDAVLPKLRHSLKRAGLSKRRLPVCGHAADGRKEGDRARQRWPARRMQGLQVSSCDCSLRITDCELK